MNFSPLSDELDVPFPLAPSDRQNHGRLSLGTSPLIPRGNVLHREEQPPAKSGELYLRFQLPASGEQAFNAVFLRMGDIQEVLSLSVQRLSPMPNVPNGVLGLMNRGNRIFWLVDLGQLLQVSRLEPSIQQHNVIILRSGSAALGLAVQQIENMQWLGDEEMESVPLSLSHPLKSFVSGSTAADNQAALILDSNAILQAPVLRSLRR